MSSQSQGSILWFQISYKANTRNRKQTNKPAHTTFCMSSENSIEDIIHSVSLNLVFEDRCDTFQLEFHMRRDYFIIS